MVDGITTRSPRLRLRTLVPTSSMIPTPSWPSTVPGFMPGRVPRIMCRSVPQIALEGTIDLEGALVLDDVTDRERIHAAHARGTPIVVRASTVEEIHAALSLGEVACALVRDERLLVLDLPQLTYG